MEYRQEAHITQEGRLAMTFRLSQAIAILQMSQIELKQFIQEEIDKNPLLEECLPKQSALYTEEISAPESTYERLLQQVRENFSHISDQKIAQYLIEFLDERGFLMQTFKEPKDFERILSILQTFHPPGIFARTLQESFLIQLKYRGEENSQAYALVRDHFDDFLNGRFRKIKTQMKQIDLAGAIEKLAILQTRPLNTFENQLSTPIQIDLIFEIKGANWSVQVNQEYFPQIRVIPDYENIDPIEKEEKQLLQIWLSQAQWLQRSLSRRKKILLQIGYYLVKMQKPFLSGTGALIPLTLQQIAQDLHLHESTISRALSNKYAITPRGVLPLKSLLDPCPQKDTIKEVLKSIIQIENKQRPYTDAELVKELRDRGYHIARRTVVKYRNELHILSASVRKEIS